MVKLPFYFIYGDDVSLIEKKFLPEIEKQYADRTFRRLDATIDDIAIGKLVSDYTANDLFSKGKVLVIRNADQKPAQCESLIEALAVEPQGNNALVFLASTLNKATRLGKLVKKHCILREFKAPELKPFDMLDAFNCKNTSKVLCQMNKLMAADYHPLALYSLICNHMFLVKQVKDRERMSPERIAQDLGQHIFRIKKTVVATRYWTHEDIKRAIKELALLGDRLRSWQYDEQMLLHMCLINLTL